MVDEYYPVVEDDNPNIINLHAKINGPRKTSQNQSSTSR